MSHLITLNVHDNAPTQKNMKSKIMVWLGSVIDYTRYKLPTETKWQKKKNVIVK